jgi:hypothetical protein
MMVIYLPDNTDFESRRTQGRIAYALMLLCLTTNNLLIPDLRLSNLDTIFQIQES